MTLPLAIALGDPAGIGPEIVAKSWERRDTEGLQPFFAVGDCQALRTVWNGPVEAIDDPAQATRCFQRALPVINIDAGSRIAPGSPDLDGARNSLDALELAVGLTRSGAALALVTAPVAKAQLYAIGFTHAGQTEFIAERCGVASDLVAMMLVGPSLKTVPVTIHLPLRQVADALSIERVAGKGRVVARGLQKQWGIPNPRLVVAGLNPHAGEGGALGREEIDVIAPAVERLRAEGIDVSGPHSADTLFHARMRGSYDAALCMYHDQALIPIKTLHFDEGVNMTLGLPIVRTSPDHGTAFEIAGRNSAYPEAMIAAIRIAAGCAQRIMQA